MITTGLHGPQKDDPPKAPARSQTYDLIEYDALPQIKLAVNIKVIEMILILNL